MRGAGPVGLTAAYLLARRGADTVVFQADEVLGGIARTVVHDGYRFDLGGHRFFTKPTAVQRFWEEMLEDDFLERPRRFGRRPYDAFFGPCTEKVLGIPGSVQTFRRSGLHRYNNQDHSMWTAVLATLNLLDGAGHDVWSVDTDDSCLEDAGEILTVAEDVEPVA